MATEALPAITPPAAATAIAVLASTPEAFTQIYGNNDIDTFQLGDRSGITGGEVPGDGITTFASDGYIFLGSKTRAHGMKRATTTAHHPYLR